MKKICFFIATFIAVVGIANAAVRDANTISRDTQKNISTRQIERPKASTARTTTQRITSRTEKNASISTRPNLRNNNRITTKTRATTNNTISRTATNTRTQKKNATNNRKKTSVARTSITPTTTSNTFNSGYNTCRDAYFTCMDQFCAHANESYRRCICSSKLPEIQSRERALGQTKDQLADFKNLNLEIINKTAAEVTAMLSATAGEYAQATSKDTSNSAKQLSGISDVLTKTKNKSLSTQGTVDIAGNINAIWSTTNLTGGANIANLTGEALYNAVHAQCSEMVMDKCNSSALQDMVTTAYGMYIENDCSVLINALTGQKNTANSTIRQTEREMQLARLENYNAHNSTSINDCIAKVREDITTETACGPDYIHCLDTTGLYLNKETGAPIYSPSFYQLEVITSLSGDVLTNQTNRLLVAELNRKRAFAKRGLDTCRDIADAVWEEFMRQAISEIYQGQQERVRQVKNECLDVVNKCYDEQTNKLKDFSNIKEELLLGQRIELSEEMCRDKLTACSNLYGGGTQGMQELLTATRNLTDQKIASQCLNNLQNFVKNICAVPGNDTLHSYPYACRTYAPGEQKYAMKTECNIDQTATLNAQENLATKVHQYYRCEKIYTRCNAGYYLKNNKCYICPIGARCQTVAGLTYEDLFNSSDNQSSDNQSTTNTANCGTDYIGSLYYQLRNYAKQTCVRPSESDPTLPLPASVLQDINVVMDQIHADMATELARECERLGGTWNINIWIDEDKKDNKHDTHLDYLHNDFYNKTSANTKWGYCGTSDENLGKK